jgi:hypothetical protein
VALENLSEMWRAGRQDDPVRPDLWFLGGQGDIKEVGTGPQVLEGVGDVGAVVVPPKAILVGCAHLVAVNCDDCNRETKLLIFFYSFK